MGLNQGAFVDALGMSREAINKMEAGKAAIEERRTAFAALYRRASRGVRCVLTGAAMRRDGASPNWRRAGESPWRPCRG